MLGLLSICSWVWAYRYPLQTGRTPPLHQRLGILLASLPRRVPPTLRPVDTRQAKRSV